MRQMTDVEIDAKLAELEKRFEGVRAQLAEAERQANACREEILRMQGEHRAWLSLKEPAPQINEPPALSGVSV